MDDSVYLAVFELIKKGDKLNAVKSYKNTFGISLMEAKDYIENLQNRLKLQITPLFGDLIL